MKSQLPAWLELYQQNITFYEQQKQNAPHLADLYEQCIIHAEKRIAEIQEKLQ